MHALNISAITAWAITIIRVPDTNVELWGFDNSPRRGVQVAVNCLLHPHIIPSIRPASPTHHAFYTTCFTHTSCLLYDDRCTLPAAPYHACRTMPAAPCLLRLNMVVLYFDCSIFSSMPGRTTCTLPWAFGTMVLNGPMPGCSGLPMACSSYRCARH